MRLLAAVALVLAGAGPAATGPRIAAVRWDGEAEGGAQLVTDGDTAWILSGGLGESNVFRIDRGSLVPRRVPVPRMNELFAGDGQLWGLVNNAGINPFYHPVVETPLSEWDEVLRVNLLGAAAFARAVGRQLADAGGGGRIVNLSSIAGLTGLPNIGPYNASKAAIDALTRTLAVELGPAGVLCNSVAPGTIATEMVEGLMTANPALKERLVAKSPLGRIGDVAEAAWPIVFLLTDAASFITGQTLLVDGGRLAAG